jgi:rod shape-determining protein MreC
MAKNPNSPDDGRERRELAVAAAFFILSLVVLSLPESTQGRLAGGIRASLLRPFIVTQTALVHARERAEDMNRLHARLDSLATILAAQSGVAEENRRLRDLLELTAGRGETFVPASVIRPGTAGSESMFLLDVGLESGIGPGDPVITRGGGLGVLGVVQQVRRGASIGLDWSHPEFRASAMTEDGGVFGIVLSQRGIFREEDRLRLNGTPFHQEIPTGTLVTTSGLGGVFQRGLPLGRVEALADTAAGWRKDYWLRPVVVPGNATHVLVVKGDTLPDEILRLLGEGGA